MKINELTLVEEHLNSNNSLFRFNAKELDSLPREAVRFGKETGNAGEPNTSIIIASQVAIGDVGITYAARICNELQVT